MHKASDSEARWRIPSPRAIQGSLATIADTPQFSLAHLTLLHCSTPELTEIAASAGYDYVSYRLIPLGLEGEPVHSVATDRTLFKRTRAALRATGLRLLDVELVRIRPDVDLRAYLPAFECAAELGARHILTSVWCEDMEFARDQLAKLCELSAPLGLTIDLEFVSFAGVATLAQAVDMLRACPFRNAGLCVDTLHFDRAGTPVAALDGLPAAWFHYAQICDAPAHRSGDDDYARQIAREGRLFPGHGTIDVRGILAHMPPMPYSIELPNVRLLAQLGPREFARRCLLSARAHLAERAPRPTNA